MKRNNQPHEIATNAFEDQEISRTLVNLKLYQMPVLQRLNALTDITAGGSTSNQLENSSGLIGS